MTWPRPPTPVRRWVRNVQGWNKFQLGSGSGRNLWIGAVDRRITGRGAKPRFYTVIGRRKRLRGFGELRIPYRPFVQLAAGRTLGPHRPRADPQQGADFGRDPDIDRASCGRAREYQAFHGKASHHKDRYDPLRGQPG